MLVVKELQNDKSLQDDIKEEVRVLGEQTSRCREILQGLSRNFAKEHVLPFKSLPLPAALEVVIASQNQQAGITVRVVCAGDIGNTPVVELIPELQHALANIISNAIQFACSAVVVTCAWNDRELEITIADDGMGYPEYILARIGEPYISSRTDSAEGVHLGLGLFIAQSLIVKKGGVVYFYNKNGAVCEIVLPRNAVEVHS
jgi:two-component system sensor histidine kinase RegB